VLSFVLANVAWSIFALQDSALTGLRQAVWVPVENILFAVVKIVLLVALVISFQSYGIFASWNISVVASLLPVNLLIFRYLIPKHVQATSEQAARLTLRQTVRYVAGNHLASLFFLASTTLLPIIVANQLGASATAYFYQPWTIATGLQLVALNMASSFTVEASFDRAKLGLYSYRILVQTMRVLAPLILVALLGAPYILSVFGRAYAAEGTALLRWLSLAALPNMVIALSMGLARVQNRSRVIVLAQGAACVLVLGLSYAFLPIWGITGVGLARLASQTIVALFLIFTELGPIIKHRSIQPGRERSNEQAV
jgi:O-antigen/teichoic acid export membrane protein